MKVLVAMSGGVDSSVAAKLLADAGHDCVGATMRLYSNEDIDIDVAKTCCSLDDVSDAKQVCYRLGIPHYVFNFTDGFRKNVIDDFCACYLRGETPNPCIRCNRFMKFDKLFERADALGCAAVSTGHYVRLSQEGGEYVLKKGLDKGKDQSYVLYFLDQKRLSRLLFPLGDHEKSEIRALAEANGFINANKPDSQDICFVPDGKYAKAIERFYGSLPPAGDYVDKSGRTIGKHKGIIFYTLGQHKGLAINSADKLFVTKIDAETNTVTLGEEKDLFKTTAEIADVNFISGKKRNFPIRCTAKTRYSQKESPAYLYETEKGVRLVFDEAQRAMTPGQAAVFYDGDVVLGGGTITNEIY